MSENLLIYHQNVIDTYLYFIKENLSLIRAIYGEYGQRYEPYNPLEKWRLYRPRAKHLQIMILIGLTAEHLVKIILLERGFVLNTSDLEAEFPLEFMQKLEEKQQTALNEEELGELYSEAASNLTISFKKNLKDFGECIALFNNSNEETYYDSLNPYVLNPHPEMYNEDEYLGYKTIRPDETLRVIQKMRNSYLHLAEAQSEQQGVVWYLFDFLVWLCKKEYPEFFDDETMIGTPEFQTSLARENHT